MITNIKPRSSFFKGLKDSIKNLQIIKRDGRRSMIAMYDSSVVELMSPCFCYCL